MSDLRESWVKLFLPMAGTVGSTVFANDCAYAATVTAAGSAVIAANLYLSGSTCLSLDGTNAYLNVVSDYLDFKENDWTIELFSDCQDQSNNYPSMISTLGGWYSGAFGLRFDNVGQSQKFSVHWNGLGDPFIVSSATYSFNSRRHIALVRIDTSVFLFVGGVLVATGTVSSSTTLNLSLGGAMRIGWSTWDNAAGYYKGNIDNVRITNGIGLYSANFTPPVSFSTPERIFYPKSCIDRYTRDTVDGGDGEFIIADPFTLNGVPFSGKLRAFDERSGRLVRQMYSNPDGGTRMQYLNRNQQYLIIGYDGNDYPALAYDHQIPTKMS